MKHLSPFVLFAVVFSSACAASTLHLESSGMLKGEGTLTAEMTDAQHTKIALHMDALDAPSKVGASTYIAWAAPVAALNQPPHKIGALSFDGDAGASVEAMVPLTDFWIFVTPEKSEHAIVPTAPPIVSAEIRRVDTRNEGV